MTANIQPLGFIKYQFIFLFYLLIRRDNIKAGEIVDRHMLYVQLGSFFTFLLSLLVYLFVGIPIATMNEALYEKFVLKLVLFLFIGMVYFLGVFISSSLISIKYRNWKSEEDRKRREEDRRRQEEESRKKAEEFARMWSEFEDLSGQYRERQRMREESERRERERRQQSNSHKRNQQTTVFKDKEYYLSVLGLPANTVHFKDIKKAYRQLMKTFHPDVYNGSDNKAKQIIEAYEKLQLYYS